ncbi:hypothetical protein [Streptomyces cacaoi]|uniref:hypothetical protein n=1 Tax=Streptomyces cacaoi TaxID=1898 RepID=UPI0011F2A119|nr:hypothetical protein [Streptomyces cacaoi]
MMLTAVRRMSRWLYVQAVVRRAGVRRGDAGLSTPEVLVLAIVVVGGALLFRTAYNGTLSSLISDFKNTVAGKD